MKELLPHFDFCVFDLETTGLNPREGCGIIEVGAVKIRGETEETFQALANPGHSIPDEITEITGLSDGDIQGQPPAEDVVDRFLEFAGDSILIAHNARFDLSFLRHSSPVTVENDYIDTLRLSRQLITADSHSLSALAEMLELPLDRAHRALDDALATRYLFLHLSKKITEPEDYFRCDLPPVLLEEAPVDVPQPQFSEETAASLSPRDWVLFSLYELDSSIGVNKLAMILCGSTSETIEDYNSITSYGQLADLTQAEAKEIINEAIEEGDIRRSSKPYPVLSLTDAGIRQLIDRSRDSRPAGDA